MDLDTSLNLLKERLSRTEKFDNESISTIISKSKKSSFRFFLISFLEFGIWAVLNMVFTVSFKDITPRSFVDFPIIVVIEKLNILVTALFVIVFYLRYRSVSTSKNTFQHISLLYRLKLTAHYYITYNLGVFVLTFLLSFFWEINNNPNVVALLDSLHARAIAYFLGVVLCLIFVLGIKYVYSKIFGRSLKTLSKIRKEMMEA